MASNEVVREIDGATEMFAAWEKEHGIRVSPSIHFTGGEPFLYDGLWEVIAYAREKGYRVAMMTNGSLIKADDAQKAFSLGVSDIQISLEGPPALLRQQHSISLALPQGSSLSPFQSPWSL